MFDLQLEQVCRGCAEGCVIHMCVNDSESSHPPCLACRDYTTTQLAVAGL